MVYPKSYLNFGNQGQNMSSSVDTPSSSAVDGSNNIDGYVADEEGNNVVLIYFLSVLFCVWFTHV